MFPSTEKKVNSLDGTAQSKFYTRYNNEKKDTSVGFLLCLLTGGIGGHEIYLGNIGAGLIYLIFCWTFIPIIISLIQLFTIQPRIARINDEIARKILLELQDMDQTPTKAGIESYEKADSLEHKENELKQLSKMRAKGLITESEYQTLRKKTLGL